jgi:fused signal recognition particle receptor
MFSFLNKTKEVLKGVTQIFKSSTFKESDIVMMTESFYKADIGVVTTKHLMDKVRKNKDMIEKNNTTVQDFLKKEMLAIFEISQKGINLPLTTKQKPTVVFMVGVNGVGKTTSTAKLCQLYQSQGRNIVLGAADLQRAAAVQQLATWAERTNTKIITRSKKSETNLVVYDAIQYCHKNPTYDLCIIDTAGRLSNDLVNMNDLEALSITAWKCRRDSPDFVFLVLDSTVGQNSLSQAREFKKRVKVNGIIMTKMDGTAKGGIVLAIANELKIPIYYIGIGEKLDDLVPFDSENFVSSLLEV